MMEAHRMGEESWDENGQTAADVSYADFRFVESIFDPKSSYAASETVDSENTCDTKYLGQSCVDEPIHLHTVMQVEVDSLGLLFSRCIQEVFHLQERRDELVQEFLQMQKPMMQVIEHLRGKLRAAQRLLTLMQLNYIAVYEDVQGLKRKVFITARECIQNQVILADKEYEVAQSAVTQEELKARIESLTHELSRLQETHQDQLRSMREQANKPCRLRTMNDVSHCRRASLSLQRQLSCSMRTLESWYEPRLMALLRRKQAGEEALRNSKAQRQDLKVHIGPLKEEIQNLELQRSCLEERIALMEIDREERIAQYKETKEALEKTLKELKREFQIQSKSNEDLAKLKSGLLKELDSLGGSEESSEATA